MSFAPDELRGGASPESAGRITGTATGIDGDTIEIHGIRIRLEGIDAPESRQLCLTDSERLQCGWNASFYLADRIGRRPVSY